MITITIHQCECDNCQQPEVHPVQAEHQLINLFMSRLDEQQRRWYAAIEAKKARTWRHHNNSQGNGVIGRNYPAWSV